MNFPLVLVFPLQVGEKRMGKPRLRRHGGGGATNKAPRRICYAEHLCNTQVDDHCMRLLPLVLRKKKNNNMGL